MGKHKMSRRQKSRYGESTGTGHAEWRNRKQGAHVNDKDKRKSNKRKYDYE